MDKLPARLADHPTVRKVASRKTEKPGVIDAAWLRQVCLEAGADDVAFASVDNPELASEREHVEGALPGTRSFISLVVKMNRDNVRSTARSVANQEFHRSGEIMNEAAHRITRALQDTGYFDGPCMQRMVDEHIAGRRDHSQPLWSLLMFEAFLRVHEHAGTARPAQPAPERVTAAA